MDKASSALPEGILLIIVILAPAALSYLLIIQWMKHLTKKDPELIKLHGKREFVSYIFSLDTSKSLSSQGLFWLSILAPVIYFISFGMVAWWGYSLRLDAEGFKTFISISPLPLGILSLAFPISASVARFHTTKQTAKQIAIVSQKNNLDLYHAHRKELFGYFQQLGEFKYLKNFKVNNKVHPRVHKSYFHGSPSEGVPKIKIDEFLRVERLLKITRSELIDIIDANDLNVAFSIYLLDYGRNIWELASLLGIPEIFDLMESNPKVPCNVRGNDLTFETVGITSDEAISAFRCAENFYHNLCDFADYESSYFDDTEGSKKLNEVIRLNGKKSNSEKIIEQLHDNHISQALEQKRRAKFFPNSSGI